MIEFVLHGDQATISRFQAMGPRMRRDLVTAMQKIWFDLQAYVVTNKLSGQVLRRVTGNLASSIHAGGGMSTSKFSEEPTQIVGKIGTNVRYAAVHEYGGTFEVTRKITQVFGRPVQPHSISYHATFPERSFLRSSIEDKSDQIKASIAAAVQESMGHV